MRGQRKSFTVKELLTFYFETKITLKYIYIYVESNRVNYTHKNKFIFKKFI